MVDLRRMRPSEMARLFNSTPQGAVITERQLHRHRTRAGLRLGTGQDIDLFRYLAWLGDAVHRPAEPQAKDYRLRIAENANRARLQSEAGRDIGELPAIVDPVRREAGRLALRCFCEQYIAGVFTLPWSPDHLRVIAKIEEAVLQGGLFAMATPRGFGKSSLCETACLWAALYGHRDFVVLIGSDERHAADMLESLKTELETNELLLADFPEVIAPIHALEGIPHRASGQLYRGERTHIGWTAKEVVLPTVPGSPASGAIITVAGITGRIRGLKFKRPDGRTARPSLVVLDDPQTDDSARSLSQCQHREAILAGAVLGLAGPGKKIAGIMPCTVIRSGDMADRILDRDVHPEWNGERTRMIYTFPTSTTLWETYAKHRADGLRAGRGLADATTYYIANRVAMDAGAQVAWPERFNHDEVSAIQHAMNLKLQDAAAFCAEYQNEPLVESTPGGDELSAESIAAKLNGLGRAEVPVAAQHLTAFIDVQQAALFWAVCAWEDDFTGYMLDYGTWPDQRRTYFHLREVRRTLLVATPGSGIEGAIYAGLEGCVGDLIGRRWQRDDGASLAIGRLLIDANWGQSTDVVYQFCRQTAHAAIVMPSHGRFVGAASLPFSDYQRKRGDRIGHHWRIPAVVGRTAVRHVLFDTNFWKSFIQARFAVPMGDPGCLSLYGRDAERHRLISEHLTAEYRIRTSGRGREVDEWKLKPAGGDNHWLDGVVGCAVGAAMLGAVLAGTTTATPIATRPRLKLSQLRQGDGERSPSRN